MLDLNIQQTEEFARALERCAKIFDEACQALLKLAEEADTPAFRQWSIYEEWFLIWHGEN